MKTQKMLIEALPKLDPDQSEMVKDFCCPTCDRSGIGYGNRDKPKLVGWCDTVWGFMMVVECQSCFTKYRFHGTSDENERRDVYALETNMRLYVDAGYFSNSEELKKVFHDGV